ncbi:MAG: hypothetical protein P4M11_06625 [Candidatus Pacebacteria bacterium]|nr:hypothetical protein [Candidatus Paceibacterota bacterium]
MNLLRAHASNPFTRSLVIKRDFTLNDIFYLYRHLMTNTALESLSVAFVETAGTEVRSNVQILGPGNQVLNKTRKKPAGDPVILVPADKMDVTTTVFEPLSLFANNCTVARIFGTRTVDLTITGYMSSEMGDYLVRGLSLNVGVKTLSLVNFSFNKLCIQCLSLCFAVNTAISNVEGMRSVRITVRG